MVIKRIAGLIFLIFIPLQMALAGTIQNLYQVEMPVLSQTEDLKEGAIQEGFLQLLFKLSGNAHIDENPIIKRSLKRASYYVREFKYLLPNTSSSQYILQIQFEPEDIIRLLKKAGVAYWSENRPVILVWLNIMDHSDMEMVSETKTQLLRPMKLEAKKFGLPLIFPMMDMAELNQISDEVMSEDKFNLIQKVSKRYAPDGILVGNVVYTDTDIRSHWQLYLDNQHWVWSITKDTSDEVLKSIVINMSEVLAKRYEIKLADAAVWLKLSIADVREQDNLNRLLKYLKRLGQVEHVRLLRMSHGDVELAVLVQGTRASFEKSASRNRHLLPTLASADGEENDPLALSYVWVN